MHSSGKAHAKKVAMQLALGNDLVEKHDGGEPTHIVNIVKPTPQPSVNTGSASFRWVILET